MNKNQKMFERMKDKIKMMNYYFPTLKKEIISNEKIDYLLTYKKEDVTISFDFKLKNEKLEYLDISEQTVVVSFENKILKIQTKPFKHEEIKLLFNDYFTSIGKTGLCFFINTKDKTVFTIPLFLETFFNIPVSNKDADKYDIMSKEKLDENRIENEKYSKIKEEIEKANADFEKEYKKSSSEKLIFEMEQKIEKMKKEDLLLKKSLKDKYLIDELNKIKDCLKENQGDFSLEFIKSSAKYVSDKNLSVNFQYILDKLKKRT